MIPRIADNRWLILAGVSSTALLVACAQIAPVVFPRLANQPYFGGQLVAGLVAQPTAVPIVVEVPDPLAASTRATVTTRPIAAPTVTTLANAQMVAVRRGPIEETLQLGGRVTPVQEASLAFSTRGTIDDVAAQAGQAVEAAQLLVTLDTGDAANQLNDLHAQLDITRARQAELAAHLTQLNRQQSTDVQARNAAAAYREQNNQVRAADATAKAQEQLRLAQVNLDRVGAGAAAADRLAAQGAAVTARGTLSKAEADLTRLTSGPTPAERRTAEQLVATAQIAARKAQAEHDRLLQPPEPGRLASARKDVAAAQADVAREGAGDSSPNAPKMTDAERKSRKDVADYALKAASDNLDELLKGPDKSSVDLANMAVDIARADLVSAQTHLQELVAPPTQEQLDAAASQVAVSQLAVRGADAHLTELQSHPTQEELRVAQKAVDDAQFALDHAADPSDDGPTINLTAPAPTGQDAAPTLADQLSLQHTADLLQVQMQALQRQLSASEIRAPYAGIVESVQVKSGDTIDARRTVVVMASADPPLVTVDVPEASANRLTKVSQVRLQLEASNAQIDGTIIGLADSTDGSSRRIVIQVSWPTDSPSLGSSVQVSAALSQKPNALLIPQRAVKTIGERRTVDVVDGLQRRTVDVKLGIVSGNDVEVLDGLTDMQTVILPG